MSDEYSHAIDALIDKQNGTLDKLIVVANERDKLIELAETQSKNLERQNKVIADLNELYYKAASERDALKSDWLSVADVLEQSKKLADIGEALLAERDEARRWARRMNAERDHLQNEIDKVADWFLTHSYYIMEGSAADNAVRLLDKCHNTKDLTEENARLRRELEALKRRLPVWFDVGYNETDQQPDGFPP